MKLIEMPANIAPVPYVNRFPLSENSIIIEDEGASFLVGSDAISFMSNTGRQLGGSLAHPYYRRLLKAVVAMSLGEGSHKHSVGLSAAHKMMPEFRGDDSANLSEKNEVLLASYLKDIKFKTGNSVAEWKHCKVEVEAPSQALYEYQASILSLSERFSSGLFWQLGFGDFQQVLLLDGRIMPEATVQCEGLIGAIRLFAGKLGVPVDRAISAWESETMATNLKGTPIDVSDIKRESLSHWSSGVLGKLNANYAPFIHEFENAIVSGGPVRDETVWTVLMSEINTNGLNFFPISELGTVDPLFSSVIGILENSTLAIDIGNGRLKAGVAE